MGDAETDRGTWWLVAQRDFWYRLRDKGFMISTGITLAVLTGLILISAYGGGRHADVRPGAARGRGRRGWARWSCRPPTRREPTSARGRSRIAPPPTPRSQDGSLDAVLVDGESLLAEREVPERAGERRADRRGRRRHPGHARGERRPRRRDLADPEPGARSRSRRSSRQDPNRETNSTVAFIAVVLAVRTAVRLRRLGRDRRDRGEGIARGRDPARPRSAPGSCWPARSWGSARSACSSSS